MAQSEAVHLLDRELRLQLVDVPAERLGRPDARLGGASCARHRSEAPSATCVRRPVVAATVAVANAHRVVVARIVTASGPRQGPHRLRPTRDDDGRHRRCRTWPFRPPTSCGQPSRSAATATSRSASTSRSSHSPNTTVQGSGRVSLPRHRNHRRQYCRASWLPTCRSRVRQRHDRVVDDDESDASIDDGTRDRRGSRRSACGPWSRAPAGVRGTSADYLVLTDRDVKSVVWDWYREANRAADEKTSPEPAGFRDHAQRRWWVRTVPRAVDLADHPPPHRRSVLFLQPLIPWGVPGRSCRPAGHRAVGRLGVSSGAELCVAARSLGLGTALTTVIRIYGAEVLDTLGVPEGRFEIAALVPVGRLVGWFGDVSPQTGRSRDALLEQLQPQDPLNSAPARRAPMVRRGAAAGRPLPRRSTSHGLDRR